MLGGRREPDRRGGALQAEIVAEANKVQISLVEPDSKVGRFNL